MEADSWDPFNYNLRLQLLEGPCVHGGSGVCGAAPCVLDPVECWRAKLALDKRTETEHTDVVEPGQPNKK